MNYFINEKGELRMKTTRSSIRVDGFTEDVFGQLCTVTVNNPKKK